MNKITILHITQCFGGGVEIYLRNMISYIDRQRFNVIIILPKENNNLLAEFCKKENISYYEIKMSRGLNIFTDLKCLAGFYKIINKEDVDIVHLHSSKAGFLGRIVCNFMNKKSIFTPHGISYLPFKGFKRLIFMGLETFIKPYTYRILACSYSELLRLQFEIGIPKDKLDYLNNGIPLLDEEVENPYKIKESFKIGMISRLTYQKNPVLFIDIANEVLKKYPNVNFEILGAGLNDDLKEDILQKIKDYEIEDKIKIFNYGSTARSKEFLEGLDIFMLTSIFEGLPLSLLEAMNLGKVCITSKCDGCNDVIQNGINGFSCITVDEFTDTIIRLINNETERKNIGLSAKKYVKKNHDIVKYMTELENKYEVIHLEN